MPTEGQWITQAAKLLVGKRVIAVNYMDSEVVESMGWYERTLVITFEDGTFIFAAQDDEGNGPGSLFTSDDKMPVIPVLRKNR